MKNNKKDKVVENIAKMEKAREERRIAMEERKQKKIEKEALNKQLGKNVDVDFEILIDQNRFTDKFFQNHTEADNCKLNVCVRKRPLFQKEEQKGEIDAVSCANPSIRVHAPKFKVDGITKYIENTDFTFDNTFNFDEQSEDVYKYSLRPLVDLMCAGGIVTVIAYGQTGSGKTFTMNGLQQNFNNDLFAKLQSQYKGKNLTPYVSFFEIYGGRVYDLLNNKNQLVILEDKNNQVQIQGLAEVKISNSNDLQQQMEYGNSIRTTHSTKANDTSSRSHAICTIMLKDGNGQNAGKVYLVDLAGSERAQDCQSNNRQRRLEGAEINKSLLALKECIRAMDQGATHIPFRASKLTLVLRDSFQSRSDKSKVIMIACISPGSSSADHTINTLRYVDRLKEKNPVLIKATNVVSQPQPQIGSKQQNDIKKKIQEEQKNDNYHSRDSPSNRQSAQNQQNKKPTSFHKQSSPRNSKDTGSTKATSANSLNSQNQNKRPSYAQQGQSDNQRPPMSNNQRQQQQQQISNNNSNVNNKRQSNSNQGSNQQSRNSSSGHNSNSNNNNQNNNNNNNNNNNSDDDIDKVNKGVKDDVRCMKETLKMDQMSQEFFDFHDKVGSVLEEQEEIFATHMAAIKEDAKLLTKESELISNVQGVGFMDYDIDLYANKLDSVIKKKLKMYNLLAKKLEHFKKNLKEEEEISNKVKGTLYY